MNICILLLSTISVWCVYAQIVSHSKPCVVMTMICRDEAVNFRSNLAAWLPIIEYFVFLIDVRTNDDSADAIRSILEPSGKDFKIVYYNFTGFGQARTHSLEEAWASFPQASHVLIADPDWSPDTSTMNLSDLNDPADVFRFTAFDRNKITKRRMDWMLKHRAGLEMQYHLHEVLHIGYYKVKSIQWEVHEIEKPGSWHTTVGHGNSFGAARYKFDLDLLYKDLELFGIDPHTHYYLGVTHEAYATKSSAQLGIAHPDVQHHVELAIKYLTLRATVNYEDEFPDQRWAVMMQLGTLYFNLKVCFCRCFLFFSFLF